MTTEFYQQLKRQAVQLIQQEKWQEALVALEQLTEIAPQSHVMAYNRGLVHWKLLQYREAVLWLRKTLEIHANYEPCVKSLQFILDEMLQKYEVQACEYLNEANWQSALSLLEEMRDYWPDESHHRFLTAVALQNTGELHAAHAILKALLAAEPDDPDVREVLIEVEEALAQHPSAAEPIGEEAHLDLELRQEPADVEMEEDLDEDDLSQQIGDSFEEIEISTISVLDVETDTDDQIAVVTGDISQADETQEFLSDEANISPSLMITANADVVSVSSETDEKPGDICDTSEPVPITATPLSSEQLYPDGASDAEIEPPTQTETSQNVAVPPGDVALSESPLEDTEDHAASIFEDDLADTHTHLVDVVDQTSPAVDDSELLERTEDLPEVIGLVATDAEPAVDYLPEVTSPEEIDVPLRGASASEHEESGIAASTVMQTDIENSQPDDVDADVVSEHDEEVIISENDGADFSLTDAEVELSLGSEAEVSLPESTLPSEEHDSTELEELENLRAIAEVDQPAQDAVIDQDEAVRFAVSSLEETSTLVARYLVNCGSFPLRQERAEQLLAAGSPFALAAEALRRAEERGVDVRKALSDLTFVEGNIALCVASPSSASYDPEARTQWATRATDAFRQSLKFEPNVATYFNLGLASEICGEFGEAVKAYTQVCASDQPDLKKQAQYKLNQLIKKSLH